MIWGNSKWLFRTFCFSLWLQIPVLALFHSNKQALFKFLRFSIWDGINFLYGEPNLNTPPGIQGNKGSRKRFCPAVLWPTLGFKNAWSRESRNAEASLILQGCLSCTYCQLTHVWFVVPIHLPWQWKTSPLEHQCPRTHV